MFTRASEVATACCVQWRMACGAEDSAGRDQVIGAAAANYAKIQVSAAGQIVAREMSVSHRNQAGASQGASAASQLAVHAFPHSRATFAGHQVDHFAGVRNQAVGQDDRR